MNLNFFGLTRRPLTNIAGSIDAAYKAAEKLEFLVTTMGGPAAMSYVEAARPTEQQLIQMIHDEIDSAPNRLLEEARELTKKPFQSKLGPKPVLDPKIEAKAKRLHAIGFKNALETQVVDSHASIVASWQYEKDREEKAFNEQVQLAKLVQYYLTNYPFAKFLTFEELNRICAKYGLMFAPAESYIREVPDKNLTEIENAQPLKVQDLPKGALTKSGLITSLTDVEEALRDAEKDGLGRFTGDSLQDLLDYLNQVKPGKFERKVQKVELKTPDPKQALEAAWEEFYQRVNSSDFRNDLLGNYMGQISSPGGIKAEYAYFDEANYIEAIRRKYSASPNLGFQIAAPKSHFNLQGYVQTSEYGYQVDNDPIVFRYCRGGILVDSKWGLEASDPALINPVEN